MKDATSNHPPSICRCRHLEECMFPRFLSLNCKQIDDFCIGCVDDDTVVRNNDNNPGRIYIEALHLKEFLKSPESIIAAVSRDHSKNNMKTAANEEFYGGLEGKRTLYIAHNDGSNNVGNRKSKRKEPTNNDEILDNLISTEIKLVSSRKALRLHDYNTGPLAQDVELTKLQKLLKPLQDDEKPISTSSDTGRVPMDIHSTDMTPTSSNNNLNIDGIEKVSETHKLLSSEEATLEDTCSKLRMRSNFERAMHEGKEAAITANTLLESFRQNRRAFWNKKHKKGKALECVWCPTSYSQPSSKGSSFEFGSMKDDNVPSKLNEERTNVQYGPTGDALIQCLECGLVGCDPSLNGESSGAQHAIMHFLMSGHRLGVTCGPKGDLFCMGCGDVIRHECFDQERTRIFFEHNYPTLSWKGFNIIRGVDPSSFAITPKHGVVWQGLIATYPTPVRPELVQAAQYAAQRISIFRGDVDYKTTEFGPVATELYNYQRLHCKCYLSYTCIYMFVATTHYNRHKL